MLRLSQERQQLLERENEALQQRLRNGAAGETSKPSRRFSPPRVRQCGETTSPGMASRTGSPTQARRNRTLQASIPANAPAGTSTRTRANVRPRSPVVGSPKSGSRGLRSDDASSTLSSNHGTPGRGFLVRSPAQVVTAADLAAMEARQAIAIAAGLEAPSLPPPEPYQQPHAPSVRAAHGTASAPQSTLRAVKLVRRPGVPLSGAASSGIVAATTSQDTTQKRNNSPSTVRVAAKSRPRSSGPISGAPGSPGPPSAQVRVNDAASAEADDSKGQLYLGNGDRKSVV